MKRALLGFCSCTFVALLVLTTWSNGTPAEAKRLKPVPVVASPTCSELILELPEDGGAWWVTVCLPEDHHADASSRWLLASLAVEPRLQSLRAQCKFHQFEANDPMFRAKWSSYVGELPALLVQMPDGKVCFKVSGDKLPDRPEWLADEIAQAIESCRPCPLPKPRPAPKPTPPPAPVIPRPIPDIRPQPSPRDDRRGLALPALLAGLAGAAAGAAGEWRKSNRM